jgi:hypothetical protein
MAVKGTDMTEITFLAGLVLGVAIGVPVFARAWRVDIRGALKRGSSVLIRK